MIEVRDLSVRLGGRSVLEDIQFELHKGDFLAVLGPNGGGKSTLVKAILGTVSPSRGSIQFSTSEGDDRPHDRPHDRPSIGYVPQIKTMDRSFPARSIELVATARTDRWPWRIRGEMRRDAESALDRAGASHLAERPLRGLSGGELQRVYLARAILGHPAILLLDEPEAGVDAAGSSSLFDVIDELAGSRTSTIVMVTHDWDVARHHASHVLLVNRQQIAFGRPDKALSEDAVRRAFGHVGHRHAVAAGGGSHD